MGHLINPISSQLKYYGSWNLTWNQYLRKDFSYFFFLHSYIQTILKSITSLKGILNRIFIYELKFFIKDNILLFFFSFKFLKKTILRHYWRNKPFFLYSKFRKFTPKKKKRSQKMFVSLYKKRSNLASSILRKTNIFGKILVFREYISETIFKKIRNALPNEILFRKNIIAFKIKSFHYHCLKKNILKKYLLYKFYLLKISYKLFILKAIIFLRNKISFGKAFLIFLNTDFKFCCVKNFFSQNFIADLIEDNYTNDPLLFKRKMSSYNLLLTYRKKGIQYYDNLIKLRFMQLVLIRVCKKRKKFVNREKVFFFKRQKLSFCRSLRKFICKLKVFLERDGSLLFLKNQQLIKLKQCLCLQLTKYTKLKVVIAWLRELITFLH